MIEDVGQRSELTGVEFDPSMATVLDVDLAPQSIEDLSGSGVVVRIDGGDGEQVILFDRGSPPMLCYHRSEKGAFDRRLPHATGYGQLPEKFALTLINVGGDNYTGWRTY